MCTCSNTLHTSACSSELSRLLLCSVFRSLFSFFRDAACKIIYTVTLTHQWKWREENGSEMNTMGEMYKIRIPYPLPTLCCPADQVSLHEAGILGVYSDPVLSQWVLSDDNWPPAPPTARWLPFTTRQLRWPDSRFLESHTSKLRWNRSHVKITVE